MRNKHLRTCSMNNCKLTGYTQRSYYLCAEHWCQVKFYATCGDNKAIYLLRHASHSLLSQYWKQINKELNMLKQELEND